MRKSGIGVAFNNSVSSSTTGTGRGWTEGRRSYHWLLTFEHAADLHALASRCQEPFRDLPEFDLVPFPMLHLTLGRVAFTDELPASRLPAVTAAVKQRCRNLTPLRLQLGWLAASTGAIRFTASPVAAVAEMRDTVMTGYHVDEGFWPHVSIAYSNTLQPAAPIAAEIGNLRSLQTAEPLVTSLALVELRREGRVYRWDEVKRVEIGDRKT